eukprot:TRINITY_DN4984_c2_g1_i1.p1 TRINITY_DN4984_c2_g1~~TRINITY_DN4984_c2_g1_i1.p1  ORF type:complete len:325 (+),score=90.77 TRINITY_DN4984_c2_g1_i1:287-1261(+)
MTLQNLENVDPHPLDPKMEINSYPTIYKEFDTKIVINNNNNNNNNDEEKVKVTTKHSIHTKDYKIVQSITEDMKANYILEQGEESGLVCNYITPMKNYHDIELCEGANRMMHVPNAGGNSVNSEALSFEMLNKMYNAQLEATEMELEYYPLGSKITDYAISIENTDVDNNVHKTIYGVSVSRAMKYLGVFNHDDARRLLKKKLFGVNESTKAVQQPYIWNKQILHIFAEQDYIFDILKDVYYNELDDYYRNNTLVIITVCNKNNSWIFFDKHISNSDLIKLNLFNNIGTDLSFFTLLTTHNNNSTLEDLTTHNNNNNNLIKVLC